jgi:mannose-6-phosphate isomerase
MNNFYKLRNQVKHYAWGSPEWIPRLLGIANDSGEPWAELWMGSHPASPSMVNEDGKEIALGELIAQNPGYHLGTWAAKKFGGLPFLLKLLAADKPLSIQAHPNLRQAQEGFERENRAGISLDAPNRNYKDANHKPEIICALTPFTGLCGFREPEEIRRLLEAFLAPAAEGCAASKGRETAENCAALLRQSLEPLLSALDNTNISNALRDFLSALFAMPEETRETLTGYIRLKPESSNSGADGEPSPLQWRLMRSFAELYPGDPAVIAPLYLNVFHLEPGEAVFLRAGILHAYVHGLGVELMANSDNVLRGGLTPKHVDVPELMKVLDFAPMRPEIIQPRTNSHFFRYPAASGLFSKSGGEFSLSVMSGAGDEASFAEIGPAICIVTGGELVIKNADGDETILKRGESVFIPAGGAARDSGAVRSGNEKTLLFSGAYTLYAASLPRKNENSGK